MKTPFTRPGDTTAAAGRSLNPLQRVYAKSCSPPTLQRWIQWLAGEGGQNAWSESLVGFSLVQYWWFAKSFSRETLARFSWKSINHWRQDVIFLANFLGGCLLFGLTTYVCSFQASITVEGTEFVIDSARAKEVSYDPYLKVGTLTTSWISKAPRGCDGDIFSMILIFFWGEVFGVVYGGICLKTNSYKLLTCFGMYRWL